MVKESHLEPHPRKVQDSQIREHLAGRVTVCIPAEFVSTTSRTDGGGVEERAR